MLGAQAIATVPGRGYRFALTLDADDTGAPARSATAPPADAVPNDQDIRFARSAGGVQIAYAASGAGLPLVRAPHWMTHLEWDWRSGGFGPLIQALSRQFRLVRFDGRACGLSDRDVAPASLDEAVADLEAVVEVADLERFALLGMSGGAAIAVRYAARHPERVTHLLSIGGFVRGVLRRGAHAVSTESLDALARLIEDGWGQDNAAFRQIFASLLWPGATQDQVRSFNELQRVACSPATAAGLLRKVAEFDASADLAHVQCPTLVMHSLRDSRVPFEEGRLIASSIPNARLEPLDSPNHTPLLGEPAFQRTTHLIEAFLRDAQRHN